MLTCWWTRRGLAGYKFVGHAEEVAQDVRSDARKANQHGGIAAVVFGNVVNRGVSREEFGAVVEIDANDKRPRFGRTIRGETSEELTVNLESRLAVGGTLFNAG